MRVYISGPITGVENFLDRFIETASKLEKDGMQVINPALTNGFMPKDTTYEEYMKLDFLLLDMCEAIYMMDGWDKSCDANREYGYALAKDKIIMHEKPSEE